MIILKKSNKKEKKYVVRVDNKNIHFGASGYKDFIFYSRINKNIANQKKKLYLARHAKDNLNNINSAGFWAKNILWNKPTLNKSIKDVENKYKLIIRYSRQ